MKLCTNCHKPIEGIPWFTDYRNQGRTFCNPPCERQFEKLSAEAQKAAHYEWVREEALANAQTEFFS